MLIFVLYKKKVLDIFCNNCFKLVVRDINIFQMEIMFLSLPSSCCVTINRQRKLVSQTHRRRSLPTIPSVMIVSKLNELTHPRRSAQYHPSVWDLKLIESLSTPYTVSPLVVIFLPYSQILPS
jgi:hypothetical protein